MSPRAPADATAPSAPTGGLSPWALAGLVAGALALAHLGLGLLLTKNARAALVEIESAWPGADFASVPRPGPQPAEASPEYAVWQRAQHLHEDAEAHADRTSQVRLLTWAMAVSFALQAGIVLRAAWRATRPARAVSGARPSSRA